MDKVKNKEAAFHIYGDLCEVKNYSSVKANCIDLPVNGDSTQQYAYFEAVKSDAPGAIEFILPIHELDNAESTVNLFQMKTILALINRKQNSDAKKLRLGIVSMDSTTIYYDLTIDVDETDVNVLKT